MPPGGQKYTTEHPRPSGPDNNSEACSKAPLFFASTSLHLDIFSPWFFLWLCFILHSSLSPSYTGRRNLFISSLYAGCAQPEIAGLTPCCELSRGNVYPNPSEHAINLFLDRRQTRMSLHEGNKDANTYPRPSWQSSHYEAVGGSNDPGRPLSQGLSPRSVPVCLSFSEVPMKCSEVQTTD